MSLVDAELSEPYSIFTYRYFVYLWPQLTFLVCGHPLLRSRTRIAGCFSTCGGFDDALLVLRFFGGAIGDGGIAQAFVAKEDKCVGTVVCKMGEHRGAFRGYIAMLVVLKPYRGRGIATELVTRSIRVMMESGCEE
ncbi:hypothetical protein BAE44_0022006, partial [Dichanthelium oligosanthes]